jgi:hypothetical protein
MVATVFLNFSPLLGAFKGASIAKAAFLTGGALGFSTASSADAHHGGDFGGEEDWGHHDGHQEHHEDHDHEDHHHDQEEHEHGDHDHEEEGGGEDHGDHEHGENEETEVEPDELAEMESEIQMLHGTNDARRVGNNMALHYSNKLPATKGSERNSGLHYGDSRSRGTGQGRSRVDRPEPHKHVSGALTPDEVLKLVAAAAAAASATSRFVEARNRDIGAAPRTDKKAGLASRLSHAF